MSATIVPEGSARGLRRELATVLRPAADRVRSGGVGAVAFTATATVLVALFAVLRSAGPSAARWLDSISGIDAKVPLLVLLSRLPLSVVANAPSLPIWGSIVQVAVVIGLAELLLGWRRVVVLTLSVQVLTTLTVRLVVWAGPAWHPGLSMAELVVRDTGPSAVVVAAAMSLACRHRLRHVALALTVFVAGDLALFGRLASAEHAMALVLGALAGALWRRRDTRRAPAQRKRGRVAAATSAS
jgi:hypothetical protein